MRLSRRPSSPGPREGPAGNQTAGVSTQEGMSCRRIGELRTMTPSQGQEAGRTKPAADSWDWPAPNSTWAVGEGKGKD